MITPRHLSTLAPGLDQLAPPVDLVARPTPITSASTLAEKWNLAALHVKRDDLSHPLYGGSKVRTLEYFLSHARTRGASGLATLGPYGSHQALTLAIFGRQHGFQTRAVLAPRPMTSEIELNDRLILSYGMDVLRCGSFAALPLAYLRARLSLLGDQRPYWIPHGSRHPLGVLSLVEGALEIVRSIEAGELPMPDDVVVATGTCATAAGLLLGFAIAGLKVRVVAVRMVPKITSTPGNMRWLAERTLKLMRQHGFDGPVNWGDSLWVDAHAGPGYGLDNELGKQATDDVAASGYFRTETTYTGKTLGLLASKVLAGRRVLFWNTCSAVDPKPGPVS